MDLFPHYHQLDAMDCGPTCLRMIAKYYGHSYSIQYLRKHAYITHIPHKKFKVHRLSDDGGTDYAGAVGAGSAAALYPTLESATFRGVL